MRVVLLFAVLLSGCFATHKVTLVHKGPQPEYLVCRADAENEKHLECLSLELFLQAAASRSSAEPQL